MNILFLALDIELNRQRGDSIHVREIVRALAQRGHKILLATATQSDQVPVLGEATEHLHRPDGSDLKVIRTCVREGSRFSTHVVYERRLSPKIAAPVSRLLGVPFLLEVNGIEEEASMQGRPDTSPLRPFKSLFRGRMIRRSARIVTPTEQLADLISKRHGIDRSRIVHISNGVDADRFRPLDSAPCLAAAGLSSKARWIVFVGNLVAWQGVEVAIRGLPEIVAQHPSARLLVVGDGPSSQGLRQVAKEVGADGSVRFTGVVPYDQVPTYIGAAEVCVAPFIRARNESTGLSPLKVFEYLACQRPVVASNLPGVRETITASRAGLLVPPENPHALADGVNQILADSDLAREMGARGRDYAVRECTWSRTAARLELVLGQVAQGTAPMGSNASP